MACLGVLFALTEEQEERLLAAAKMGDAAVRESVHEIESGWDEENLVQVQKLWDAIHRCLSDGTTCFNGGTFPLNRVILGGHPLYKGDDYIVAFVPKNEVPSVAKALTPISEAWLRERFFALRDTDFPQMYVDEEWCGFTWDFFEDVRDFYQHAAEVGRAVIFTADQ